MAQYLGVARTDITPTRPLDLAGFASRNGHWDSIYSPLYAEAFVFGEFGGGVPEPRAVLVCADLVWWGPDVAPVVRAEIARRVGIPIEGVLLHATHTHGGPATSMVFSPSIGRPEADYIAVVGRLVAETAETASGRLEPVTGLRGRAEARIGINRRRVNADGTVGGPDPSGDIDREVVTIRYVRPDGGTVALLVHFACHPSTRADREVSADFPGSMKAEMRSRLGADVVVGFLQGCSGDIRVDLVEDGDFRNGSTSDVARLGGVLAAAVQRACGQEETLASGLICARSWTVGLSLSNPTPEELARRRALGGIWAEWSAVMEADSAKITPSVPIQLSALALGDGLSVLGFDAEVSVVYGQFVKARSRGRTLPIAYTNGMIGYVVTAEQVRLGGYEPAESYAYLYRPGPFDTSIEATLRSAIEHSICALECGA